MFPAGGLITIFFKSHVSVGKSSQRGGEGLSSHIKKIPSWVGVRGNIFKFASPFDFEGSPNLLILLLFLVETSLIHLIYM